MSKENKLQLNQKNGNDFIADVSGSFSVTSYSIIDTNGPMYVHWSEGLNMIIEKDGVTMKLNSDEIQQIVKALPRTVSGRY
jgi:peroxiredoxin